MPVQLTRPRIAPADRATARRAAAPRRSAGSSRVRHVGDDDVLRRREADVAGPVVLGDAGQLEQLLGGDPADRHGQADVVEPGLLLRDDAEVIGGDAIRACPRRPPAAACPTRRCSSARNLATPHSSTRNARRAFVARRTRTVVAEDQRDRERTASRRPAGWTNTSSGDATR